MRLSRDVVYVCLGSIAVLIATILLNHDIFIYVCLRSFDFRITNGRLSSPRFTFTHLEWDGTRAWDFVFNGKGDETRHVCLTDHAQHTVQLLSLAKELEGCVSSFVNVSISYLANMGVSTPFRACIFVSMRHKLKDPSAKGNFLSMATFLFNPKLSFYDNAIAMTTSIDHVRNTKATKMSPLEMIKNALRSRVILNSWRCGSDSMYLLPEQYLSKLPFQMRKNPTKIVTFAKCPRGWYLRAESVIC